MGFASALAEGPSQRTESGDRAALLGKNSVAAVFNALEAKAGAA
jgi:hypothetical protein